MRKAIDWATVKQRLAAAQAAADKALSVNPLRMPAVFRERAERLARSRSTIDESVSGLHVLCFMLGAQAYGLELSEIAEVLPLGSFTAVPSAPEGLLGVFNLRGEIVPLIDLAAVLGLSVSEQPAAGYVVMLRDRGIEAGLKVDQLSQIKRYAAEDLYPQPPKSEDQARHSFKAVARDATQILSLDAVLNHAVFNS